mmetsp:Transcript_20451/g.62345  ORF Transcript_20451/g.62345 Transcript_20451/m.62345 type:complete len:116 (-) Transcript_20451:1006-1353(-)
MKAITRHCLRILLVVSILSSRVSLIHTNRKTETLVCRQCMLMKRDFAKAVEEKDAELQETHLVYTHGVPRLAWPVGPTTTVTLATMLAWPTGLTMTVTLATMVTWMTKWIDHRHQ